jgi:uncharacterized membrane protein
MGKRESNALIFLLCLIVGILFALLFFALLEAGKFKGRLDNSTRENARAALILREEYKKMQKLLKTLEESNGREP